MNEKLMPGLIVCAIVAVTVYGQNDSDTASATSKTLKNVHAGKFFMGAAGDLRRCSDAELANIETHYNILTPENCMKPQPIHPAEDRYNGTTADTLIQGCEQNVTSLLLLVWVTKSQSAHSGKAIWNSDDVKLAFGHRRQTKVHTKTIIGNSHAQAKRMLSGDLDFGGVDGRV